MQSLDLTMVNEMLREVYVNDILPKKAKKNPLQGYRSEAAMTTNTINTAKRSGKKRDISCLSQLQGKGSLCQQMSGQETSPWGPHHEVVLPAQDAVTFRQ